MKYVITGAAGHISKPLAEKLLETGHEIVVIGRNAANLKPLIDKGAKVAIGSVEDVDFLTQSFQGADAVYTMVPPKIDAPDWKGYIGSIGENYHKALEAAKVPAVVNLSSVGAHLADGGGPVSGLYKVEKALNRLANTHVLHLRPCYFFQNFLSAIPMVQHMNILGSNFGFPDSKFPLSDPRDIAETASTALIALNFKKHSHQYLASDERTTTEIAQKLGAAIGKPDLPWVVFTDDQMKDSLQQAGLPQELVKNYTEMGAGIRTGIMLEDFTKNHPSSMGKVKLEEFAKEFAKAYKEK